MTPIEVSVRVIVDLLVRGDYAAVERITQSFRMSAAEIDEAISEYGRTLIVPDLQAWWPQVVVTPVAPEPSPAVLGMILAAVVLWALGVDMIKAVAFRRLGLHRTA